MAKAERAPARAVDDERRATCRGSAPRRATRGCCAGRGSRRGGVPRPTRRAGGRRRTTGGRPPSSRRVRFARRDLVDLGAGAGEELPIARHYFREYSESTASRAALGEDGRPVRRPEDMRRACAASGEPARTQHGSLAATLAPCRRSPASSCSRPLRRRRPSHSWWVWSRSRPIRSTSPRRRRRPGRGRRP